jgi:hypothetical protein
MDGGTGQPRPSRAALTVWAVVNAVCLLQAAGFATRPFDPWVNDVLGVAIALLAIPATWALVMFLRIGAGWLAVAGPVVFDLFVVLMLVVDYAPRVEWRDPAVPAIMIPYLALFFGGIILMGLPMYRSDRRRWLVTVASAAVLVAAMLYAMRAGVA